MINVPHIRCRECGAENAIIKIEDVRVQVGVERGYGFADPRYKCTMCGHDGAQPTTVFVPAVPRDMLPQQQLGIPSTRGDATERDSEEAMAERDRRRAKARARQQDPIRRSRR